MTHGHCIVCSRDWQVEVRAVKKEIHEYWIQPIVNYLLCARWEPWRFFDNLLPLTVGNALEFEKYFLFIC